MSKLSKAAALLTFAALALLPGCPVRKIKIK